MHVPVTFNILRWIVSAAHCFDGETARKVFVRIGDHDIATRFDTKFHKKQTLRVKKIFIHPNYNYDTTNNDLALIKLRKRIIFHEYNDNWKVTVAPVCIPRRMKEYDGLSVTVAGWGQTDENDEDSGSNKVKFLSLSSV